MDEVTLYKESILTLTRWVEGGKNTQVFINLLYCSSWIHSCYSNTPHDKVYWIALHRALEEEWVLKLKVTLEFLVEMKCLWSNGLGPTYIALRKEN